MPIIICIAGILGMAGVISGAFGAHGLMAIEGITDARLRSFNSAADILLFHAPAVLATAALVKHHALTAKLSAGLFAVGATVFSVPLFIYAIADSRSLVMLAPAGGLILILGWTVLAISGARLAMTTPNNSTSTELSD